MSKNQFSLATEFTAKDNQSLPFIQLHQEFAITKHGQKLQRRNRFNRYRDPQISSQEWVDLFGQDANNLGHMPLTYGLVRQYLRHYQAQAEISELPLLTESEIEILLLTALTHDRAEAVTGDVTYELKTASLEKREAQILRQMLLEMTSKYLSVEQIEQIVQTAFDKQTKLGEVFSIIEKIGYLRTAINVWQHQSRVNSQTTSSPSSHSATKLDWLVFDVISNQLATLVTAIPSHPPLRNYLLNQESIISDIFNKMPLSVIKFYPAENETNKAKQFHYASRYWQQFLNPIQEPEVSAAQ
jgi:hypothetical protein